MNGVLAFLLRLVEFIAAFGALVFLHELGHYIACKAFHIQVEEFGFGFPPRAIKLFQFHETEFTLNWLPFGAFVRPKGENDPNIMGGLARSDPLARLIVLSAGPLMNLVIGVLLFTVMFAQFGEPDPTKVIIDQVVSGTPAFAAGLQTGDVILKINDQAVANATSLQKIVAANLGKSIQITYERSGKNLTTSATPRQHPPEGQGALGIVMGTAFKPISSSQWLPRAIDTAGNQIHQMITLPIQIIRGQIAPEQGRVIGVVGIFNVFDAARTQDEQLATEPNQPAGINTLSLLAMLSIALGITNLLPIPALDGGRILFVLPELLLRRRIPARYENLIHLIGFVTLILLMIYVTTQDIINPLKIR